MKRLYLCVLMALFCTSYVNAQWTSGRPGGHAPIQVMGDHTHNKGEFMFSYRYMNMNMDGNMDGTEELSTSDILIPNGSYMVAPESMLMQMHMLGMMYATSDKMTLMGMFGYVQSSMDHVTAMGGSFTTESSGISDLKLSALYKMYDARNSRVHANIGFSIPTGSIDEKDQTPMSGENDVILPYPMQPGSGSFEFSPGFTYLTQTPKLSIGSQVKGVIYLNENDNGYKLGNRIESTSWVGYYLHDMIGPQLSLRLSAWDDINGENSDLNPDMVHTADPDLKGGSRVDVGFGINLVGPDGPLHDWRLAVNYDLPVYQYLQGPQMKTAGILIVGVQYSLH